MIQLPPSQEPHVKGQLTNEIARILDTCGQEYTPALLPKDIERGPLGRCFDVCHLLITFNLKYTYVEGKANDPDTGEWIYHGWLTDGVHAFDPTWYAEEDGKEVVIPPSIRYIGIPFPGALVGMFNHQTGYQGILGNRHRWPKLVDHYLKIRRRELEAAK